MNKWLTTIFFFVLVSFPPLLYAQQGGLKGTVKDAETGEALVGANVILQGTNQGAATDTYGKFLISNIPSGSYNVAISFIGYATYSVSVVIKDNDVNEINVLLTKSSIVSEQIVISASRRPEKLTEAPATIDVITSKDLENFPTFNTGELFARQKGVDYVRAGVLGIGINIRGLNNSFNTKNLQMNDNKLSTLVATGLPLGVMSTTVKEDVERIEIILGPAAVLYGPNAHNGLVNVISKDPRTSEGTIIALGGGSQSVFSGRFRHAGVVNDKFSFKVTGEYTQGLEYNYTDSVYVGIKGYPELDLDRRFSSVKGEASLYYSLNNTDDIIVTYGTSISNNIGNTNAGRNLIKDWKINILQGRYVSPHIFAQIYHTWSNTSDTYAMNQRTQNYVSFINAGFSVAEAKQRSFKEAWFATSPTTGISLKRGAVFEDASRRWNGEAQYNNTFGGLNLITGAQWQRDIANSNHTYLLDDNGPIQLDQIGGYAQLEYQFKDSGFKVMVAGRGDNHELYGFNFVPKAALLYTIGTGTFRVTYGKGIASPSILNLNGNLFGGLILGNGEGFTLSDGTKIAKLEVETINTFETGYKGLIEDKWFVDVNGYYNKSEHFITPLLNIATSGRKVTKRGDTPMSEVVPGTPTSGASFLLTYLNFGKVDTYGADISVNYFMNDNVNFIFNYSYFGFKLDTGDLTNDGNKDGKVDENDLPMNTPTNKLGFGINFSYDKFFGTVFTRWTEKYDYISGINVAASTNTNLVVGGSPVVENARVGRSWNYGPLGGFVNVDVSAGYRISPKITLAVAVVNLFDTAEREFAGSPFIDRLVSSEIKFNF